MALNLDARQRAMLEEMHVRVWWPLSAGHAGQDSGPSASSADAMPPPRQEASMVLSGAPRTDPPSLDRPEALAADPPALPQTPFTRAPHAVDGGAVSTREPVAVDGWPALAERVGACQACGLCAGRHAAVLRPAVAPAQRDWMVVGEPPNADEERAGEAFTGEAGLLLDNMLRAAGVSRRADGARGAWVTNIVKCRPAIARIPQDDELLQCRAHLDQEIALVRPRVILAMGRFATLSLLGPGNPALAGRPFGQLRGSVHAHAGVPVVVMQHPERLLRAPAQKAEAWADLCQAMEITGVTTAAR